MCGSHTSSRLSQDSAALWSGGISGSCSWICLPDTVCSHILSSAWQLLDTQLDGWAPGGVAGAGQGAGLECKSKKSRAAADARSLTGLTSASNASASSARTRVHSFSISLTLALNCCRETAEKHFQWGTLLLGCLTWFKGHVDRRGTRKPVGTSSTHCRYRWDETHVTRQVNNCNH